MPSYRIVGVRESYFKIAPVRTWVLVATGASVLTADTVSTRRFEPPPLNTTKGLKTSPSPYHKQSKQSQEKRPNCETTGCNISRVCLGLRGSCVPFVIELFCNSYFRFASKIAFEVGRTSCHCTGAYSQIY